MPLVFLHAFPLDSRMWAPQRGAFNFQALDLPGFGDSPPFSSSQGVEDTAHFVASQISDEKITLAGLSMGGYVALAFARLFPERLNGLILCDTKAERDDEAGKAKRGEMIELARNEGAAAVVEKMIPNLLGDTTWREKPEVVEAVRNLGAAQKPETLVAALKMLRDRPDATPFLSQISVPTLILGGEEDKISSPDVMGKMAAQIPGARREIIEKAGHLSNLEQPEQFNAKILDFLRDFGL